MWRCKTKAKINTKAAVAAKINMKRPVFVAVREFGNNYTMCDSQEVATFDEWQPDYDWELNDKMTKVTYRGYHYSQLVVRIPEECYHTTDQSPGQKPSWAHNYETGMEMPTTIHLLRHNLNEPLPVVFRNKYPKEIPGDFHSAKVFKQQVHSIYASRTIECTFMLYKMRQQMLKKTCDECVDIYLRADPLFNIRPFIFSTEREKLLTWAALDKERDGASIIQYRMRDGDRIHGLPGALSALGEIMLESTMYQALYSKVPIEDEEHKHDGDLLNLARLLAFS